MTAKGPRATNNTPDGQRDPAWSADALTRMGLSPFPLRDHDPADPQAFKRPRNSGWQDQAERPTEDDLKAWDKLKCNYGLHLGLSFLVVVDTDTAEAEEYVAAHCAPTPWMTKTAKGWHRYYLADVFDGAAPPKNGKPYPGVDLKSEGGYVLSPGSWHYAGGCHYEPVGDWTASIMDLPTYDPAWFPQKKRDVAPAAVTGAPVAIDRAEVLKRAGAYLDALPPGVSGEDGHTTTFTAALKVAFGFSLEVEELYVVMAQHFNPRCEPPWSEAELRHKCEDAYAASLEDPRRGHLLASDLDLRLATVTRLAALHPLEYEKLRITEAKALKIRVTELDKFVEGARNSGEEPSSRGVRYPEVNPWPEPVDAAWMLSELRATIHRHIVLDKHSAIATALWITFSWFVDHAAIAPLLLISSPEKRCGKSQLLAVVSRLVRRPLVASNISPSAVFRVIERDCPTLLIDEADTFMKENEELRGVINSGHTRDSAYVIRTVGDDHEPQQFSTWGAKAISGIGKLDRLTGTLTDRAIVVNLRRRLPTESITRLRYADPEAFTRLASMLARLGEDFGPEMKQARPSLPEELHDRAQDNWEPLLAIADHAGGEWPSLARAAALSLSGAERESATVAIELLTDVAEVFRLKEVERIGTNELLQDLISDELRPWHDYRFGKQISARQLSELLGEFGIVSKSVKFGYAVKRGYQLADLQDAFTRYLPPPEPQEKPLLTTPQQPRVSTGSGTVAVAPKSATVKGKVASGSATRHRPATSKRAPLLQSSAVADSEEGPEGYVASGDGLTPPKRAVIKPKATAGGVF